MRIPPLFFAPVLLRSLSRTTKKAACQSKSALIPRGEVADGAHCSDYLKHARHSDAAFFWIPAFAGMTSCPRRRASIVRAVWETATDLVQAASELCAVSVDPNS